MLRSAALAVVALALTAAPAFAQTPILTPSPVVAPTVAKPAPPWTFYMAILTIGIAALTLLLAVLGYMVQAPGFRRGQSAGQTPGGTS